MRTWCSQNNCAIVEEYVDTASGSGKVRRPAFERMMADAEAGKFGMVVFWALDRFSREGVLGCLRHLERLDKAGVCYRSHVEPFLDSCGPFKDVVLALLSVIAKQERIRISERVKAGLEKAAAAGRKGGRRPVERDQGMLAKVTEMRAQGYSFNQIQEETGMPKSTAHRLIAG
jgi:DNA invertase Pin-like site-specific DNA recombinase